MNWKKNLSIIEECFRNARITDEISASSVSKYRDSLKKFFSIVNKDIPALDLEDFKKFIRQMQENGASNSRIANVISAVKWIIKKIKEDNMANIQIDLDKIKKPRIKHNKEVMYLTTEEIACFLGTIRKDIEISPAIRKVRMMALSMLLLQTGARIGEALSIQISKIDRRNNEVPIIGKGQKPRNLLLSKDTLYWIDRYLEIRKSDNDLLFVRLDGQSKWEQTNVGRSFRYYKERSGITKPIVLHTLRHTTATQLQDKGVPLNVIQKILGHSKLETTVKYYLGAAEKKSAKKVMEDEYYRFIPESAIYGSNQQNLKTHDEPSSLSPCPLPGNTYRSYPGAHDPEFPSHGQSGIH